MVGLLFAFFVTSGSRTLRVDVPILPLRREKVKTTAGQLCRDRNRCIFTRKVLFGSVRPAAWADRAGAESIQRPIHPVELTPPVK